MAYSGEKRETGYVTTRGMYNTVTETTGERQREGEFSLKRKHNRKLQNGVQLCTLMCARMHTCMHARTHAHTHRHTKLVSSAIINKTG